MRGARAIAAGVLLGLPGAAPAAVRALFVGIDHYAAAVPDGSGDADALHDLHAAAGDALRVRDAFVARYGIAPGTADPGCAADGETIVLLDGCATRRRILASLIGEVGAAAAGDTVLFFYSGHGALADEAGTAEQGIGKHSTIVPADARRGDVTDILDIELRAVIDAAAARGVSVVTIFDSCHAGTATRDLRPAVARAAPPLVAPAAAADLGLDRLPPPGPGAAEARPYRVHLAAAGDLEIAKEVRDCATGSPGCASQAWHGVFSRALAEALAELPAPTYADLIAAARRAMAADDQSPAAVPLGGDGQHLQAEGALATPVLGVRSAPARRFAAEAGEPGTLRLVGGRLAGVTPGSTYGVYASVADARPDGPALARGLVSAVTAGSATLAVATPLPAAPLVALELTHAYGAEALRLRLDAEPGLAARLTPALAGLGDAVTLAAADPAYVLRAEPGGVGLATVGGAAIGSVLDPGARDFAAALADTVRKVAQAHALLALAGDAGARLARVQVRAACADDDGDCAPLPTAGDETLIPAGTRFVIRVQNRDPVRPLYAYAFYLDADYGILPLLTPEGAIDPPLRPNAFREVKPLVARGAGRDQVVVILSERPVDLAALAQDRVRDLAPPPAAGLARLLRLARDGRAARDIVDSGDWAATILPLRRVAATAGDGK